MVRTFAALLPVGEYLPLLLAVEPRLRRPVEPSDYFAEEQVATWGLEPFWGLPEYPRTPYYRTFETSVDAAAHLFEFIVPMVPPSWGDPDVVAAHAERLWLSSRPTAVAVSILDVCEPATDRGSSDHYAHWGLTHFLLDGHHKMLAAAESGRSLRLLSLLSLDGSMATSDQIGNVCRLRAGSAAGRGDHDLN